jgi:hypothetical protein
VPEDEDVRDLPDPGFAGDDGTAAPETIAVMQAYAASPDARHGATLAVLQDARLLVPVVALLGEAEHDERGLARDKTSDMAAVLMKGRDGRTALLAFTGTESLHRWDPDARPVPVGVRTAAEAALREGAAALVIDVAGPVRFVVETDDLGELARGSRLVPVVGESGAGYGWAAPPA